MLTTEERRLQFVEHVQKMRTAQKAADDVMAKYYERQVDRALIRLQRPAAVFPTAEEVCETLELIALFAPEDDSSWSVIYRLTHCRERDGRCENPHEDWVKEFRIAQAYMRHKNKAPRDPTKIHDMVSPFHA